MRLKALTARTPAPYTANKAPTIDFISVRCARRWVLGLTDRIELAGEDFENDECKAELAETGTNVSSFESALSSPDLDQFLW